MKITLIAIQLLIMLNLILILGAIKSEKKYLKTNFANGKLRDSSKSRKEINLIVSNKILAITKC